MAENPVEDILGFWFGQEPDEKAVIDDMAGIWWGKKADIDREIRQRFGDLHQLLGTGVLDSWRERSRSRLALIILADQFSRNIFRDSAAAFEQDELALKLALVGIEKGMDRELRSVERVFFYMPLEHSESLAIQQRSVELFRRLAETADPGEKKAFDNFLDFAVRHQEIIKRFGRFPHRNEAFGRRSTDEEITFLAQPGSSF